MRPKLSSPYLSPARSSPPPEAQLGPPPAHARAMPTVSPAPPVSRARPRSLTTALSLAGGPCLSAPSPSPVISLSARLPPATACPVASPLTRSPARFGALRPAHCARAILSPPPARAVPSPLCAIIAAEASVAGARHLSFPPPRPPIKGPPRAPYFPAPGLSHSIFSPWTQSSSTSSSLRRPRRHGSPPPRLGPAIPSVLRPN
jgi:hypothetical protein